MNEKSVLRAAARHRLESLSPARKREGSEQAFSTLSTLSGNILSFSSKASEIDLTSLNHHLASQGRLFLPKIVDHELHIFRVTDVPRGTALHPFGMLEPLPEHCERVSLASIDLVLVPGLAFTSCHRLGYGKGFYDRFFAAHPFLKRWGVGFEEQRLSFLPVEEHDISLDSLSLF